MESIIAASMALLGIIAYWVIVHYYKRYIYSLKEKEAQRKREEAVAKTLDRFFEDTEKSAKLARLAEIDRIRKEMEEKIQQKVKQRQTKARVQLEKKIDEAEIIEEGGRIYLSFMEGLKSAMPTSEEEKKQDMEDLMAALKALESFDQEHYKIRDDHSADMGKGMLYDRISQKINRIIRAHHYKQYPFIQAEKLEVETFEKVKKMEHYDFIETLHLMKETGMIRDLIEINPQIHLLVFQKEKIKFSQAEKVVIAFAAEHDILTIDRLQEQTQWKPSYLNDVLKSLEDKGFLEIKDNNIIISGLITAEERKAREAKLEQLKKEKEEKEKKKLEEARKRREKIAQMKKLAEKKRQEELLKKQEKLLSEARVIAEKEAKMKREEAERIAEQEEAERLKKIKAMPKPKIKALPSIKPTSPPPTPKPPTDTLAVVDKILSSKPKAHDSFRDLMAGTASQLSSKMSASKKASIENDQPKEKEEEKHKQKEEDSALKELQSLAQKVSVKTDKEEDITSDIELSLPSDEGFGDEDLEVFKAIAEQLNETPSKSSDKKEKKEKKEGIDLSKMEDLEKFFQDDGEELIDDEDFEYREQMDFVINFMNDLGSQTGGLITLDTIRNLLKKTFPDLGKAEILEIVDELKKSQILLKEYVILGHTFYVFDINVHINKDMLALLKAFIDQESVEIEDMEAVTDWEREKIESVLSELEKMGIVKKKEEGKYVAPVFIFKV